MGIGLKFQFLPSRKVRMAFQKEKGRVSRPFCFFLKLSELGSRTCRRRSAGKLQALSVHHCAGGLPAPPAPVSAGGVEAGGVAGVVPGEVCVASGSTLCVVVLSESPHAASPRRAVPQTRPVRSFFIAYVSLCQRGQSGALLSKCMETKGVSSHSMTGCHAFGPPAHLPGKPEPVARRRCSPSPDVIICR